MVGGMPALAEAAPLPARTFTLTGKLTSVVDGDTIKVKVGSRTLTVNLRGAVTASGCTTKAVSQLRAFNGKTVSLRAGARSGTVNATVKSGATDLSVNLVRKGLANVGRTTGLSRASKNALNSAASSAKRNKQGRFASGGCAGSSIGSGNSGLRLPAGWTVQGSIDSLVPLLVRPGGLQSRAQLVTLVNEFGTAISERVGPGRAMFAQSGSVDGLGGSLSDQIVLCRNSTFIRQIDAINAITDLMEDSPATQLQSSGDSASSLSRGTFSIKLVMNASVGISAVLTLTPTGGRARVHAIDINPQSGRILGIKFPQSGYATGPQSDC